MKCVVTGSVGFVGCALSELLVNQLGADFVVAVVGPAPIHEKERERYNRLQRLGVRTVASDLRRSPVLDEELADFDVLFHLAAYVRTEENSSVVSTN